MRSTTLARSRHTSLELRRYVPYLLLLMLVALSISGLLSGHAYVNGSLDRLRSVTVATQGSFIDQVEAWWSLDANHLHQLQSEWPASIPTLLGEIGLLWIEKEQIVATETVSTESGFSIIPAQASGRLHLISAAINSRLDALRGSWNRTNGQARLLTFHGYPIDRHGVANIVDPAEVEQILGGLDLPASVLAGYQVTLLPFALEKTAGLGAAGESIVGAAPAGTQVSPNRTAYTLLHELGHHVHFTFMDHVAGGDDLWQEYMQLRGIETWSESGAVDSEAWTQSPQETFAEDFRMLFGGDDARAFPHATAHGDPTLGPDGGEAVRSFILRLISR